MHVKTSTAVPSYTIAFEMNILRLHEEVDTLILLLFILVKKNKIKSIKIKKIEANIVILCFILLLLVCYAF